MKPFFLIDRENGVNGHEKQSASKTNGVLIEDEEEELLEEVDDNIIVVNPEDPTGKRPSRRQKKKASVNPEKNDKNQNVERQLPPKQKEKTIVFRSNVTSKPVNGRILENGAKSVEVKGSNANTNHNIVIPDDDDTPVIISESVSSKKADSNQQGVFQVIDDDDKQDTGICFYTFYI